MAGLFGNLFGGGSPAPRIAPPPPPPPPRRSVAQTPIADPMIDFKRRQMQSRLGKGNREDIFAGFLTDRPPGLPKLLLGG